MLKEYYQTNQALGGDVSLVICSQDEEATQRIFKELWISIFKFEKQFSRFLPNSELSDFNRNAGTRLRVTEEFRRLLETSLSLSRQTKGLYNPFVLPALQRMGYKHSALEGYETDSVDDFSDRTVVAAENIELGAGWARIPYGTAIDMGGCGKGYLGDLLGNSMKNQNAHNGYWFSLGGDIISEGYDADGNNWEFDIQDAENMSHYLGQKVVMTRGRCGLATSGTFKRVGQNISEHHIINPTTGRAASTDVRLATVCAPTALMADVIASCAVIVGSKKAIGLVKKMGANSAVIQYKDEAGVSKIIKFGTSAKSVQKAGVPQYA